jgi:hypothetical protein
MVAVQKASIELIKGLFHHLPWEFPFSLTLLLVGLARLGFLDDFLR